MLLNIFPNMYLYIFVCFYILINYFAFFLLACYCHFYYLLKILIVVLCLYCNSASNLSGFFMSMHVHICICSLLSRYSGKQTQFGQVLIQILVRLKCTLHKITFLARQCFQRAAFTFVKNGKS